LVHGEATVSANPARYALLRSPVAPWVSDIVYKFTGGTDGGVPNNGGLAFGSGVNGQSQLYGATFPIGNPPTNGGVVYRIQQ